MSCSGKKVHIEMYKNNLVSVIIPTYNIQYFLDSTLESIVNQTYKNLEIILIDDCSNDGTYLKIIKWADKDSRIVYRQLEKNSGAAVSRNVAIGLSNGRFLAFCDSDDLWQPDKIEKQISFMRERDIAFCFTQYVLQREDGKSKIVYVHNKLDYEQSLRNSYCITTSSVVIDRLKTGDVRIPLARTGQDHLLWWSLMKKGFCAYALKEPVTIIRVRKDSLSEKNFGLIKKRWSLYHHHEGIPFFKCLLVFMHYAINGIKKYRF